MKTPHRLDLKKHKIKTDPPIQIISRAGTSRNTFMNFLPSCPFPKYLWEFPIQRGWSAHIPIPQRNHFFGYKTKPFQHPNIADPTFRIIRRRMQVKTLRLLIEIGSVPSLYLSESCWFRKKREQRGEEGGWEGEGEGKRGKLTMKGGPQEKWIWSAGLLFSVNLSSSHHQSILFFNTWWWSKLGHLEVSSR